MFLSKVCKRSAGPPPQKYDWLACDTTPGRQDGCIVVIGKILEKTIDPWFIPICFDHSGLHVIGNEHFRDAAEEAQSALDCANHILSLLKIGRASCRERVEIYEGSGTLIRRSR